MPDPVRTFLAECFLPGVHASDVEAAAARARAVADDLRANGTPVEYLGALLVEQDEVVFHAFRARALGDALDASRRAGLPFERVIESVEVAAAVGAFWSPAASSAATGKEMA